MLLPCAHVGLSAGISFSDVWLIDAALASPFGLFVYWRTLVHARRFQVERLAGFQPLVDGDVGAASLKAA